MSKISELPEKLSAMVDADLFVIVDSAEADPNLQTKKITKDTAGLGGGGGGDFADGGEAGGADRSLGNTDDFALSFLQNGNAVLALAADDKIDVLYGAFESQVADGASAVAFDLNTANALSTSGAKIASFKNNGAEKFYINKDGVIYAQGASYLNLGANNVTLYGATHTVIGTGTSATIQVGGAGNNGGRMELDLGSNLVDSMSFSFIQKNQILFSRGQATDCEIKLADQTFADQDPNNLVLEGSGALPAAVTNLVGGGVVILAGNGASSSGGDAHGGNVEIDGGIGYGTGHDGDVLINSNQGRLQFFGSTGVAQQSGTGETTGFTAGSGTGVNDDSTFTGNVGSTAYRISDVVKALKNYGLLAS